MNTPDTIAELSKYYKKVLICINDSCGKAYGSDLGTLGDGLCPICQSKIQDKHSMLEEKDQW